MSSSIFFKFKSQREPQRVSFDGTGISVFELKREIINISKLGDGTDFDLTIYSEDMNEEYDDDTTIVPRSTTVIARRLPASKPGQGRAARYVSGRMPVNAKNSYRTEHSSTASTATTKPSTSSNSVSAVDKAQTEEERIKAMLEMGGEQWEQQRQHMSTASRVPMTGFNKQKNATVPDHPPPPGYVCYRCGQKGHWIQVCPTNNDPNFDGKPRIKRITGIPRSFLKTVEESSSSSNQEGLTDDARQPASVMVNAEGDRVVAVPDQASWDQYQEKAQASAAQKDVAATGNKELEERGLECPIDKRLFVDPMKTPCCGTTYCNECIENALVNSDLVCPKCSTEGVLLDNLAPDEDAIAKIKIYEEEKKAEKQKAEKTVASPKASPEPDEAAKHARSPIPSPATVITKSPTPENKKKRPAEDELKNDRKPASPTEKQTSTASSKVESSSSVSQAVPPAGFDQAFIDQMNALAPPPSQNSNMNMPFPMPPNFPMGMNMSMPPNMAMPPVMMNPMMMGGQWNNMSMPPVGGFPQYNMNGNGMFDPNMNGMPFPGQQPNWQGGMNMNMNMNMNWMPPQQMQQQRQQPNGVGQNNKSASMGMHGGGFVNQQFSQPSTNEEDNAYMRKPVNPHRHQGRQKKIRPTDYREL